MGCSEVTLKNIILEKRSAGCRFRNTHTAGSGSSTVNGEINSAVDPETYDGLSVRPVFSKKYPTTGRFRGTGNIHKSEHHPKLIQFNRLILGNRSHDPTINA